MAREVWILAGQSNASGSSGFAAMVHPLWSTIGVNNPYPAVLLSDKISSGFSDPLVWDVEDRSAVSLQGYSGGTMGTAMGLGRRLDALAAPLGRSIGIAQVAITGTFLGGATPQWAPGFSMVTPPNPFNALIAQVTAALTAMSPATAVGVIWVQGEADAGQGAAASAYATNLRAWRTALMASFPSATLLVLNRVNTRNGTAFLPVVRAQQELVATDPRTALVNCDDIPLPNGAHYDAQGYWELGNRLADAAWSLQNGTTRGGTGTAWRPVNLPQIGSRIGEFQMT